MRLLRTFSVLPSKARFAGFPWVSMATLTYVKLICVTSPRTQSHDSVAGGHSPLTHGALKYGAKEHEPAARGAWMSSAGGSITILGRDSQWIHPQETRLVRLQLRVASSWAGVSSRSAKTRRTAAGSGLPASAARWNICRPSLRATTAEAVLCSSR